MPEPQNNPAATRALRRIGTFFCERYRISRLIGIGGTSAVYAGVHRNGHSVAIKVLHERLSDIPEVERRFRREALIANRIQHSGVVPIIDDDVADDGSTFLVMPLLLGETVRARATRQHDKRLPIEDVIVIADALLDVLETAHARKIVHRDIKPDNIFITSNGEVRVFDFGIARFFESDESATITHSGYAIGTPAFMAPEQVLGHVRDIDGQTDLWAVGATMFTLLGGHQVHEANSPGELLVRAATKPPRPLASVAPEVPSAIGDVVNRALAFTKGERWPDASAMRRALSTACESALGVLPTDLPRLVIPDIAPPSYVHDATTLAPAPAHIRNAGGVDSARSARSPRGRRGAWLSFGIGACAVILVGGASRWVHSSKFNEPARLSDASPPTRADASLALEAGLQLWRDASTGAARAKFGDAARREPGLAAAHLYYAAALERLDPEVRAHLTEARALRGRLTAMQNALLDALEPLLQQPPDNATATRRLEELTSQFPDDPVPWIVRGSHELRVNDTGRVLAILDRIPGPLAHWFRGRAEILRDHLEAGRTSLQACVASSPQGGVDCLIWLARLETNEGRCEDAALASRRLIAIDHDSQDGYRFLARAEYGLSHRTSAVRAILEERWAHLQEPQRELERQQDEFDLAVEDGAFDRAYLALDAWDKAASRSVNAWVRAYPFTSRLDLELELDAMAPARRTANAFIEASQTWLPEDTWDIPTERSKALYFTAQIDRNEFRRRQGQDAEAVAARGGFYAAPGVRWIESYALGVKDAEDARFALGKLPTERPLLDAAFRDFFVDAELGRVYLLVGQLDNALASLRRAANSCLYVRALHSVHAHAWYGDALAKAARSREACEQYNYVLQRWGHEPRSRTVRAVREGAARLKCPPPSVGGPVQGAVNEPEAREENEHGAEGHR